jgi:hypothetical protein
VPWVVLAVGLLVLAVVSAFYLLNRPRTVNINLEATPTANPVAQAQTVQAGPPPTFTPPPAALPATATPLPTPTRVPVASPGAGFVPAGAGSPAPAAPPPAVAPSPPPAAAAAPAPAPTAAVREPGSSTALPALPGTSAPAAPTAAAQPTPPPAPTAPPTPTPFAGQVGNAGGMGNTRSDVDAAYGAPTGETPDRLVAYRRGTTDFHVGYTPEPPRAWVISELVPQGTQMSLDQAMAEARKLFPRDAQPRGGQPEGNDQFVVERFTSPTLGQAISADQFAQRRGNPGDFLAVYSRDSAQAGRITRVIVGIGDDPNILLATR